MNLYAYLDDDLVSMHLSERLLSFESEVADMSVKVYKHGQRTTNKGINQRYLKNQANVADKIYSGRT